MHGSGFDRNILRTCNFVTTTMDVVEMVSKLLTLMPVQGVV